MIRSPDARNAHAPANVARGVGAELWRGQHPHDIAIIRRATVLVLHHASVVELAAMMICRREPISDAGLGVIAYAVDRLREIRGWLT